MHYYEEKINNVTLKFVKDLSIEEDFEEGLIGNGFYHVPEEIFLSYAQWCRDNKESLPNYSVKEYYLENDSDVLFYIAYNSDDFPEIEYLENTGEYYIKNADVIIAFTSWLLHQSYECSIIFKYHHIMWFFHDLIHIKNDVDIFCNINVNIKSELNAIYSSLERCKKENIEIDYSYKCLVEMFNKRFKTTKGHDFEHFFEEEYEEYEEDEEYFCMVCNNDRNYCMICGSTGDEE
jgi:hypothetical protein